ncbi:hypothetical protein ATK78_2815 [Pedobacter metabolipauper]|uniref:Lipoprotein n=2 Tax=Pedobacter metabolipauper TaxID=425513 RepID=A0A4R6STM1_9SPHI|nr:hypothetical protein ATK78_2815 [Pedobacter metabolipauper]
MLVSCKKHNNDPEPPEQATHVVTGKLYGKDFTFASGKASREIIDFQEEGFEIFLSSAKADGCASPDENFHVIIRTPRKVGKFPDYYAILADPASSDYAMFTDGNVFEVTSISGNTIKGYLKVTDPERNSAIEGTFEATICN